MVKFTGHIPYHRCCGNFYFHKKITLYFCSMLTISGEGWGVKDPGTRKVQNEKDTGFIIASLNEVRQERP